MDIKTDRQRYWQKILIHLLTDRLTKQETDLFTYRLTDNQAYTWTGIQLNKQSDKYIDKIKVVNTVTHRNPDC